MRRKQRISWLGVLLGVVFGAATASCMRDGETEPSVRIHGNNNLVITIISG